jgi:hypothetical protein
MGEAQLGAQHKGEKHIRPKNLSNLKILNKKAKLTQLASYHAKILKDGILRNGVKNICNIHL